LLRRYVHEDGKIRPRRQSGNCAKHQRKIAIAIKRARHLALLPFSGEVLR
jgi:small subunit ribosomal protein S18